MKMKVLYLVSFLGMVALVRSADKNLDENCAAGDSCVAANSACTDGMCKCKTDSHQQGAASDNSCVKDVGQDCPAAETNIMCTAGSKPCTGSVTKCTCDSNRHGESGKCVADIGQNCPEASTKIMCPANSKTCSSTQTKCECKDNYKEENKGCTASSARSMMSDMWSFVLPLVLSVFIGKKRC